MNLADWIGPINHRPRIGTSKDVIVTPHAVERMRERYPSFRDQPLGQCRRVLRALGFRAKPCEYECVVVGDSVVCGQLNDGSPIYLLLTPDQERPNANVILTVLSPLEIHVAGGVRKRS